jgi:heme o synthase
MSTISSSTDSTLAADIACERRGALGLYMDLTKARLSALVVLTTAVGFLVAVPAGPSGIDWMLLLWTVLGTSLAAGSAAAFNQLVEVARDRKMRRTQSRPLPSRRMSMVHAFIAATVMGYLGIAILGVMVNMLASGLALLTILIYVLLYTPMKTRSTLNTLVGAVCGAIPPMIGWAAATGSLATGAWVLGAILFIWQLPHFLSLAWIYRDDYARAGFVMLPNVDQRGVITAQVCVLTSLMLMPLGLIAVMVGLAGWFYAIGSVVLAAWMTWLAVRFYCHRTSANARKMFIASILYLSVLLMLFMIDRGPISNQLQLAGDQFSLQMPGGTAVSRQLETDN